MEYSKFEQEIRNPGKALSLVIDTIAKDKLSNDEAIMLIDDAIEDDIGFSRQDVIDYFNIYSDMYKDAYGFRPHGLNYTDMYYNTIFNMVHNGDKSSNYSDYYRLSKAIEEENDRYEEEIDNVTLDGKHINNSEQEDREYNEMDRDYNKQMEDYYETVVDSLFEDEQPFRQSHHKTGNRILDKII